MIKYIYNEQEVSEQQFITNLVDFRIEDMSRSDLMEYDLYQTFFDDITSLVIFTNSQHSISDFDGTYRIETDLDDLNLNMLLSVLVLDRLEEL